MKKRAGSRTVFEWHGGEDIAIRSGCSSGYYEFVLMHDAAALDDEELAGDEFAVGAG